MVSVHNSTYIYLTMTWVLWQHALFPLASLHLSVNGKLLELFIQFWIGDVVFGIEYAIGSRKSCPIALIKFGKGLID